MTIVNSECHKAYEAAFTATKKGLYAAFNLVKECGVDGCSLCQFIKRHDIRDFKTLRVAQRDALPQKFPIAKPSSDNCAAFIKFAKKEFGKDAAIQQCGGYISQVTCVLDLFLCYYLPLTVSLLCPAIASKPCLLPFDTVFSSLGSEDPGSKALSYHSPA